MRFVNRLQLATRNQSNHKCTSTNIPRTDEACFQVDRHHPLFYVLFLAFSARDRINALKGSKHLRLVVDLNHLRSDGRGDLAGRIMRRPAPYMYALREAARDVALAMDPAFIKTLKDRDILIGFEGR